MFGWLRNFFGSNGNNKENGKIAKANLVCESQRMVIDLQKLNDEITEAMKPTEKHILEDMNTSCGDV